MEEAEIRMEIYLSLAIAFGRPGRQRFCQQNEGSFLTFLLPQTRAYLLSEFRKPTLQLFSFIKQNAEQMDDQFWQNLEIEYNRLFVGPYSPKAPPYESKYTNPSQQMLNSCRVCLLEDYGQENLNLKQDFYDLPDHIVVELEFMALLCEKELHARINHNTEKALKYLLKQYDFLVNHLSKWCSEFSKEIASKSKSILYHSLAVLLRDFISDDLEKLRDEIYKLEVKVLNSPTQSQHKKDRMLLIHKKIKTEEAEYSIEINSADCILCGVCVSCCPTNAFRMNNSQRRIQLLFKAEICTGCEQCLALCPRQAIQLSAGVKDKSKAEKWIELAATLQAACSKCGQSFFPDKAQKQVQAHFTNDQYQDTLFEMLSLCSKCRKLKLMESFN